MPTFSTKSKQALATCDPKLQLLFNKVIQVYDCTIIWGQRGKKDQTYMFDNGLSRLEYPLSKHNKDPSKAIDAAPYPIDWKDENRFYYFAGLVKGMAIMLGIGIRWGGDWDGDNDFRDQNFMDLAHFELVYQPLQKRL